MEVARTLPGIEAGLPQALVLDVIAFADQRQRSGDNELIQQGQRYRQQGADGSNNQMRWRTNIS